MRFLINEIIKLYKWRYFPFVVFTLGMLLFHSTIKLGWGDDHEYLMVLNKSNLNVMPFIIHRYFNWSSRVIIEPFLIKLVHFQWLWRILDTAVMVIMSVSISKLIPSSDIRRSNWIIAGIIFIYPISHMSTAGWIATTMNYSWPLAFGLFSMIPIKKILFDEKIKSFEYIFYITALLFALNQEQMCAIVLSVYLVFTIYLIIKKRPNLFMFVQSILGIASIIFILTCPGNYVRKISEVKRWFPEYPNMSLLRKIEMGYSSSLFQFIINPNIIFTLFSGLLLICMIITNKKGLYKVMAAVPFATSIIFGYLGGLLVEVLPIVDFVKNSMTEFGTGIEIFSVTSWLPDVIITFSLVSVLFSLYVIFENKKYSMLSIFIVLLGFGSRIIMAFSPTIWASSLRTFIFMYFAFIICSVILFQVILDSKLKKYIMLSTSVIGFFAGLEYLKLFA
ncbi:DUF6056 family protein [Acetivibrio cellulolyticus]|uniref:DUF6056 family protein n=1 Tax=Acetivibrio cellulolyticus TaxID=35830 RepID=UPI0001E2CC6D|nr:DUF6056 family protein [Acetivibrio cellulolyticus]